MSKYDELESQLNKAAYNCLNEDWDNKIFALLVKNVLEYVEMSDPDMAEIFGVSVPTVMNWKAGATYPHPKLQRCVFDFLMRELIVFNSSSMKNGLSQLIKEKIT